MKTAISLPDATFARVDEAAGRLGVSRSEIIARAAECYLDELEANSVTDRINAVLAAAGGTDQSNRDATEHAVDTLVLADEEW